MGKAKLFSFLKARLEGFLFSGQQHSRFQKVASQTEVQVKLAAAGLDPRSILHKVDKLIKSKKFKQEFGVLRLVEEGRECRCYVGLISEVLVAEGLYTWPLKEHEETYVACACKLSKKGKELLGEGAVQYMTGASTNWLGIPNRLSCESSLTDLNDKKRLSFEAIHKLVVKELRSLK